MELTDKQIAVLRCAAAGKSQRKTAVALGVAPNTVHYHQRRVREILRAVDMKGAVEKAIANNIIEATPAPIIGARDNSRNPTYEEALFRAIKKAAQKSISCPSNAEFAEHAGLSLDITRRAFWRLIEKGRVTRELKGSGDRIRRLVIHPEGDATSWTKYKPRAGRNEPRAKTLEERACMCCGEIFESAGKHNRLCGRCRSKDDDPLDPFSAPYLRAAGYSL